LARTELLNFFRLQLDRETIIAIETYFTLIKIYQFLFLGGKSESLKNGIPFLLLAKFNVQQKYIQLICQE
jgi:hypothetical protein